jgi:hypothetical protein
MGLVYIPTIGKVEGGPFRYIDPVAVVPISEISVLRRAFQDVIAHGNPPIPNLRREDHAESVVARAAGVKTYAAFASSAMSWTIEYEGDVFRIKGQKKLPRRGWVDDPDHIIALPNGTDQKGMIEELIRIIQEASSQPSSQPV